MESPFTRRRPGDGRIIYQLKLNGREEIDRVIDALQPVRPDAIDVNCGCPAPLIKRGGYGTGLFCDPGRCETVFSGVRRHWDGPFFVKCRLGIQRRGWKEHFVGFLRICEQCGVDALVVHPRFGDEKLKRRARTDTYEWIAEQTAIPVIANGDISSLAQCDDPAFRPVRGFMIGRMAVVQPWIFSGKSREDLDYREIWNRYFDYCTEDFPPERAIGRIKEFTTYYARNFLFGQQLYGAVQSAETLESCFKRANAFLCASPKISSAPGVAGI